MTPKKRSEYLIAIAERYGIEPQTDMLIEEMAELTKALLKHRRAKAAGKATGQLLTNIADEMADVKIMLEQIEYLFFRFGDNDFSYILEQRIDEKIKRQLDRIAAERVSHETRKF